MTFGELTNILGIQQSKHGTSQVKIEWIRFYFPAWGLYALYENNLYKIVRYRNEDGIFDGTLDAGGRFIEVEKNLDDLQIIIKDYNKFFIDVFENKSFQTNFKDNI